MALVLIDSHAILHRAYHALPKPNFKRKGQLVNAVYGFFSMLLKAIDELKPDYLAACFDAPGPTFRHEQFIGYQANRPKMADELREQIELARTALKKAGILVLIQPGFEADDLIGTIVEKSKIQKPKTKKIRFKTGEIVVVTGDKDLMQLVDDQVKLFLLSKGISGAELVGPEEVEKKLGVRPGQVVDYKALVGDPSDNYPGVAGIGPKTAGKLLAKFGRLEKIWPHLDEIDSRLREKLEQGRQAAELSYRLALINRQAPIKFKLSQACWSQQKLENLRQVLKDLGFPSLVKRIDKMVDFQERGRQMGLF